MICSFCKKVEEDPVVVYHKEGGVSFACLECVIHNKDLHISQPDGKVYFDHQKGGITK